jgi:penicillin G amidase
MKKILLALGGLLLVLVLLLAAGRWHLGRAAPDPNRDGAIAGLEAPVEVWRDSLGVPHVWAGSETDLFRAMGYVHAQDRLFQMELFRRVADGRMAEVLGADLIDTDRFLRTVGMGRAAAADEDLLDAEDRRLLQAYADGVNAWIAHRPGPLPPEFVVLRFRPEPWTIRNSLSIAKIMSWDLADWEVGLDLQRVTDRVGEALAAEVHPHYPDTALTILGTDAEWRGRGEAAPARAAAAVRPVAGTVPAVRIPPMARRLVETVGAAHASNSWVIGGERTASGKPIVANDMHLALRAPAIWYLAALHGGGYNVTGMTLPGIPIVVAGHSDRIAWAYTNAMVDDVDFYVEEVSAEDSTRYRTPDGWAEFVARPETIRVKGGEPVVHVVRTTRNGPVISDVEPRAGGRVMAMRWTAYEPSSTVSALRRMNLARDADEFADALRGFDAVHQNVVFADADGRYGYRMVGRVPVRRSGTGLLPVPGWTGEGDWVRFLDFDEHPRVSEPADGFIATANHRQIGPDYPHHIGSHWAPPQRGQRIRQMLEGGSGFTAADVARQQMDVLDLWALEHLPYAVAAAERAGEPDAAGVLRAWDGHATEDSRGTALFYVWADELRTRIAADEFEERWVYFPRSALSAALHGAPSGWIDDVRTDTLETLDGLAADAMRHAVEVVGTRTWGDVHETRIDHALGQVRALDRALGLNVPAFPSAGSPYTVNPRGWAGRRPPFVNTGGASQRHVVDMADVDGAGGFIIPTGQSGVPFSRHYTDQNAMWREGRLWLIPLDRARAEARAVSRMTLRPRGTGG